MGAKKQKGAKMATKAEIAALVAQVVTANLEVGKKLTQDSVDNLIAEINTVVGPKTGGGGKRDISEITLKNENGELDAIFDTVAQVWLPSTSEFFYEEKKNPDEALNGLKNHSKAREKLTKEIVKCNKQAKDIVWDGSVVQTVLTEAEVADILGAIPKVNYARIVPYGDANPGSILEDADINAFEATIKTYRDKINAAKAPVEVPAEAYPDAEASEDSL